MPTQNEATARTNDAMPAATLGSPSDEDAIIDVREPRWERSVVTAARGNGATPYHHERDRRHPRERDSGHTEVRRVSGTPVV
jgi:hypothetical protein